MDLILSVNNYKRVCCILYKYYQYDTN